MKAILVMLIPLLIIGSAAGISLSVSSGSGNNEATMSTIAEGDLANFHQAATLDGGSIQAQTTGSSTGGLIAIDSGGPIVEASGTFDLAASSTNGQVSASVVADGHEMLSPKMSDYAAATGLSVDVHQLNELGKITRASISSPQYYDLVWENNLRQRIPQSVLDAGGRAFLFSNQIIPNGATKAEFIGMAQAQAAIWNTGGPTLFASVTESSETNSEDYPDGKNMLYFTQSLGEGSSILALTANWHYTGQEDIVESDTMFNPHKFDSDGSTYSFEQVSLHEFGHAAGQDDLVTVADPAEIMYGAATTHPVTWDAPNSLSRGAALAKKFRYTGNYRALVFNSKNTAIEESGLLVPNRDNLMEWEGINVVTGYMPGTIALLAWNGKYVCAENGGGSNIAASRDWAREWESFTPIQNADGTISLKTYGNYYVCAEDGGTRELVANRLGIGAWEKFNWGTPMAA